MADNQVERLLTPKEVAHYLGVAISTVYKWSYTGELPHIVIQRRKRKAVIRFRPVTLETWLKKREIAKPQVAE